MSAKLSSWFSDQLSPTQAGVYERRMEYRDSPRYALWDGAQWFASEKSVEEAALSKQPSGFKSNDGFDWPEWRGLAKKP